MNVQKTLTRFESVANEWLLSLDSYSEEQFTKKPDADSWSIGQVYNHLIAGTNRFHMQHIASCLDGKGKNIRGGKKFPGKFVFLIGSFPDTKIKVPPSDAYTPKQPAGIADMRSGLIQLIEKMRATAAKIGAASNSMKTEHPAFGYLNAQEWFAMIEMHFRHHLRQKARLDKSLILDKK
ncbi:DinB family protein [bacterium]|nr:DinB family protein [bacterium]